MHLPQSGRLCGLLFMLGVGCAASEAALPAGNPARTAHAGARDLGAIPGLDPEVAVRAGAGDLEVAKAGAGAIAGGGREIDRDGDGFSAADGDCNDRDMWTHPGAEELCDGLDQDCNGTPDDHPIDAGHWYADLDGDGFPGALRSVVACAPPPGYASSYNDCDDADPAAHPGQADDPDDGRDDNCNGLIDESALLPGDLVLYDARHAAPARDHDERIVLYNTTLRTIDLQGFLVIDGSDGEFIRILGSLPVSGQSFVVLGRSSSAPDVPPDYVYGSLRLSDDRSTPLTLRAGDVLLDTGLVRPEGPDLQERPGA